jgi:L-seryl-tRNA(Ser) seleniumtransferase
MSDDPRRQVPATNDLLGDDRVAAALEHWARPVVMDAVRSAQQAVRDGRVAGKDSVDEVLRRLPTRPTSMRPVINATGVVVHTNLGRAPLAPWAVQAIVTASGYVDVEFDVYDGARRERGSGALRALGAALPEAGGVAVVNNGAAALLLALTVTASGREIIWSRGEMVEIGDGFRLHDLAVVTGARIREVGTSNRTTVADYAAAMGPETGCLLKVHPSNFRTEGFTSQATVRELAALGPPLVVDVGSGLLRPDPLLRDEPDVATALQDGAHLVTASGDKLLGGPQAGIVAGGSALVRRLRRHPLARAVRVDKLTLAALEATLLGPPPPVWQAIRADPEHLRERCAALAARVGGEVVTSTGVVGGGGAPGTALPGWAVALDESLARPLRLGDPSVVGRVEHGLCLLDLRCVPVESDAELAGAVLRCM